MDDSNFNSAEERYRSVIAALQEGVIVHDDAGALIACNDAAVRLLGLDRVDQFVAHFEDGRPFSETSSPTHTTLRTGEAVRSLPVRIARPGLDDVWVMLSNAPLFEAGAEQPYGVVTSLTDITAHKRAERELTYLAYHDALTGLPNRTLLEEHLGRAVARSRRAQSTVALLHLDLDGFRLVNDSLGHAAGDELLCRLAVRLQEAMRTTDVLARLGGDELALLVSDIAEDPVEVAEHVAGNVLAALSEPFVLDGVEFQVGASIGIATSPQHAADPDGLIRAAEAALYRAKVDSRGGWAVAVPERHDPRERLSMTARLRRALVAGEFELHYQPIYALPGLALTSVEALLRWNDPERGMIPPGAFIPLAEETGLIETIGDWVVHAACSQQVAWAARGFTPRISFNVSPRQLRRGDFVNRVAEHLEATGADPAQLIVELTESATLRDPEKAEPLLAELHALGLGLAIDDFGAGYSSLSRLRHMPVGTLKIDRSFLRDVPDDHEATTIVLAILALAQALNREVVAEGVETEEQRAFLERAGCTFAQGFLLARPMPALAVEALVAQRAAAAA